MGPRRPKHKGSQNRFKMDVCICIIDMNPTQLEQAQIDVVCEIYHDMFVLSKRQNLMTVQSVQC
jgi:hypothetical protein